VYYRSTMATLAFSAALARASPPPPCGRFRTLAALESPEEAARAALQMLYALRRRLELLMQPAAARR